MRKKLHSKINLCKKIDCKYMIYDNTFGLFCGYYLIEDTPRNCEIECCDKYLKGGDQRWFRNRQTMQYSSKVSFVQNKKNR